MKKRCMSCGALNKSEAKFCKSCGAEQQFKDENYLSTFVSYFSHLHSLSYILIFIIVLLLFSLFILLVPHGYEKALKNYFEGIVQGDTDKFIDALTFDEYYDYIKDDRELWREFNSEMALDARIQCIKDSGFSLESLCVRIIDNRTIDKEELELMEDRYSEMLDQHIKITDGRSILLELRILDRNTHDVETFTAAAYLIKAKGEWFVAIVDSDNYPFDQDYFAFP